jgi:hypothetical protein
MARLLLGLDLCGPWRTIASQPLVPAALILLLSIHGLLLHIPRPGGQRHWAGRWKQPRFSGEGHDDATVLWICGSG